MGGGPSSDPWRMIDIEDRGVHFAGTSQRSARGHFVAQLAVLGEAKVG